MANELFTSDGKRKYLNAEELERFIMESAKKWGVRLPEAAVAVNPAVGIPDTNPGKHPPVHHLSLYPDPAFWLLTPHFLALSNPASFVRGPKFSYTQGKTPILTPNEARRLIRSIPTDTLVGRRDRALIGLMIYTFGRISAAVNMNIKDVYEKQENLWVRLHEKGGKHHEMPCQHNLKDWLRAYIEATGIGEDKKGPLFRTIDRKTRRLGANRLDRQRAWAMVKRRAKQAGIETPGICNHTFRGTGITAYLENPEAKLEHAQQMAAHADPKTTRLYDRRRDKVSLDEVERIGI